MLPTLLLGALGALAVAERGNFRQFSGNRRVPNTRIAFPKTPDLSKLQATVVQGSSDHPAASRESGDDDEDWRPTLQTFQQSDDAVALFKSLFQGYAKHLVPTADGKFVTVLMNPSFRSLDQLDEAAQALSMRIWQRFVSCESTEFLHTHFSLTAVLEG